MFHIKNSIATSLALIVLLMSSAVFAEGDGTITATNTDTVKATPKKQPNKKRTAKAAPKPVAPTDTTTPPSNALKSDVSAPTAAISAPPTAAISAPPTAVISAPPSGGITAPTDANGDSAVAIKQRSGPGNPIAGKDKSELCQGCHGEEGLSPEGFAPQLAGQYGIYIAKQLRNFQSGARTHQIMSAIAATISDDDLADIAAYFASRTMMKGDGADNKLGKELFLHGDMSRMMVACVNCHGVNGKGKTPTNPVFPVIGGQHKDYLRGQLINFRAGDRSNSPGGVMNIITQKLTDAELEALAEYVAGL